MTLNTLANGWMRGGHLQTLGAARLARTMPANAQPLAWAQRQRWITPDQDFIDVDTWLGTATNPTVVLFHGLEGGSSSHYARAFAYAAQQRGWTLRLPHFRACSGEINRRARMYHAGDADEIDWIMQRVRSECGDQPLYAVGVSLGGNALAKWLATCAPSAAALRLRAAATLAAPLDLTAAGVAIEAGLNRHLYTPMFLRTMRAKAKLKWQQFPGCFDLTRATAARTIREFDDAFTAPLHGYASVHDYWARASAKPDLHRVRTPTLVINARDDPFVPWASLRPPKLNNTAIQWCQPLRGGHAGFVHQRNWRAWRGEVWSLPLQVLDWLHRHG